MEKKSGKKLNKRALAALIALLSGIGLPLTGLAVHLLQSNSPYGARHFWVVMHEMLGMIFTISTIWHVLLNRQGLLHHVRYSAGQVVHLSREILWASVLVGIMILLALSHTFFAHS